MDPNADSIRVFIDDINGYREGDSSGFVTPAPIYEGALTDGEQANADFVDQLEGQALLEDLQSGGYVIYIRHAQTERDFADQVTADVTDFSTQRVVSEFGTKQSLVIGEGFAQSEIPFDTVITSEYGRAIETAAIAFGQYEKNPALNFLPFEEYTDEQIQEMRDNVTPLLTTVPNAGTNTIIVGHDDLFEAGTGIYPDPQGIAYLLKPDGAGDFDIIANLLPEEWAELSPPVQSFLMIPDSVSDRILLFDSFDGSLVNDNFIDGSETGLGIFETPINAIQVNQEIWVSDQVADAIFRFDLSGNYLDIVSDADGDGDTDGLDNIRGIEFIDNLIYVANAGDGNDAPGDGEVVVVFDTAGNNLGSFDTGDPYDIRAYNGELLITDINSNNDGGEDIDRYTIDGINSTFIDTFHESDGETGVDFPQQITLRESTGTVLVGGFSTPGGVYEYDINGNQVGFFGADEGFANRLRAAYELGNGNILWSGGDGMIVTDPSTGVDVDIYTVNNQDFRPSARYIEPLVILPEGDRNLTGAVYVADQTLDTLLLTQDLTGDGDANDPLETSVFFDGTNESGFVDPTANIFTVLQATDGSVFYGDGNTDTVYRLTDANRDGDALDAGEATVWFAADNAEGLPLLTPNGLAIGSDGAIYITEADTVGTPNGDFIYRTEDLNGDGDANDAGEASIWLDLKAVNPNSSPFEITFIDDTAYIIDSVGGDPNVIYRAQDLDGSGMVETDEVSVLVDESVVPVDFGLTTDGESLFTVE
ncbi:MAG: hypothetical protein F6K30_17710, partial [Cyanothece sp. SIO2G6]|nr:hypothetical protein [Cyanothece sp. SIO2G6]